MADQKPPPKVRPVLSVAYDATVEGWNKFGKDALLAHRAGYKLECVVPLGSRQSFGALWFLVHQDKPEYASFADVEDGGLDPFEDF